MISPLNRKRYQDKNQTYPTPTPQNIDLSAASWQQTPTGVRYGNEQEIDLNNRALSYNSNYVGAGSASDQQLVDPVLRRSQTMPNHLSPNTSSFRISQPQNGSEHFSENLYSRAPFATMTASNSANFSGRDGKAAETSHENQIVSSSGLAQRSTGNSNPIPERREVPRDPDERQLPPRDVTLATIEEAYVSFIMCCNPSVPLSTDDAELRKGFNSPPKSDGKTFKTFTLFELIRKLEMKELKTWAQLAIELGVEPPVLEKGQSAQKVQQYAVRLKRWMHAMHVDAFFEYLLGKSHVYWTQIPSVEDGAPEFGRDGVPAEEDLALRALLPETRPKRGRRKAEDKENDEDTRSPAQRPRLSSPTMSEEFSLARSAHPDNMRRYDDVISPWTPEQGWRLNESTANTPLSAHPQSAVISRANNPFLVPENEPRSAITPTTSRSRRRHGPAVSSAWPSSGNNSSGKLRGRPPSNRSITDGPFSTFPANPNAKVGQTINFRENNSPLMETPIVDRTDEPMFSFPPAFTQAWREKNPQVNNKPDRLHLQVPERVGGTVRLATPPPPPPTVVINGGVLENGANSSNNSQAHNRSSSIQSQHSSSAEYDAMEPLPCSDQGREILRTSNNHVLPNGHAHLQTQSPSNTTAQTPKTTPAPPPTQNQPSTSTSPAPVPNPSPSFKDEPSPSDRTNIDDLESHFRLRILSAEWSDTNNTPCPPCTIETADLIVKQTIRNLRDESTSQEAFLINLAALAGGRTLMTKLKMKVVEVEVVDIGGGERERKTVFESRWTLRFGGVEGSFTIRQVCRERIVGGGGVVEKGNSGGRGGEDGGGGEGIAGNNSDGLGDGDEKSWKAKYLELQNRFYQKDDRVWGIRKKVLDVLAETGMDHVI